MQQEFLKDMIKPEEEMPFPVTLLAYSAPGKKQLVHVRSFNRDQLALHSVFQPLWGHSGSVSNSQGL